jgi:hypothetical protein
VIAGCAGSREKIVDPEGWEPSRWRARRGMACAGFPRQARPSSCLPSHVAHRISKDALGITRWAPLIDAHRPVLPVQRAVC